MGTINHLSQMSEATTEARFTNVGKKLDARKTSQFCFKQMFSAREADHVAGITTI